MRIGAIGPYRCSCRKVGEHLHREPYPWPVEGYIHRGGKVYEIMRTPGEKSTWIAREVN